MRPFLINLEMGDILIGEIERKSDTGFVLRAICCDAGKRRDLSGLDIKLICPYSESIADDPHVKIYDCYSLKDTVRVEVTDRIPVQSKISVTMKGGSISKHDLKLGLLNEDDLPVHYKRTKMIDGASYHSVLNGILTFSNPAATEYLLSHLGPTSRKKTFIISWILMFPKCTMSKTWLWVWRKSQSAKWASKSVQLGVQLLKQGKTLEAHQAIAKALQIDAENVDALVTRGCLHANSGNLRKGFEDFEQALKYQSKSYKR